MNIDKLNAQATEYKGSIWKSHKQTHVKQQKKSALKLLFPQIICKKVYYFGITKAKPFHFHIHSDIKCNLSNTVPFLTGLNYQQEKLEQDLNSREKRCQTY